MCVCVCVCVYVSHTLSSSEELPHKYLHLNLYLKEKWEEKLHNYMDVKLYENEYDQVYNNLFSWKINPG